MTDQSVLADVDPLVASVGIKRAAAIIGVSIPHLNANYERDGIPHYWMGRRLLFPVAGLHSWVAEQAEKQARGAA